MTLRQTITPTIGTVFWLDASRLIPAAILAASLGALAIAYIAEYGFGLEPCPLCLWQRMANGVAALLGLTSLGVPRWRVPLVGLAGVALIAGAGVAGYHFGVEQQWWSSAVCAGDIADIRTTADLRTALAKPLAKTCDTQDWVVFGVSITAYNALASAALAAFALAGARHMRRAGREGSGR